MAVVQNPPFIGDPMSTTTVEQVIEALRPVEDPELHRSIVDLDMVHDVAVSSQGVSLTVTLTVAGCPMRNEITDRVTKALTPLTSGGGVSINFGVMTDAQREKVRMMLNGNPGASAGSGQAHGHAEGRVIPFAAKDSKTRPLLIASGKGGVGKSTLSTNLAIAMARAGRSVGLVDADIYGPSQARMMGVSARPASPDGKTIIPLKAHGVTIMSIGLMLDEAKAVVWRGPMLMGALQQMLGQVAWGDLDVLLVDLPPGTGDVAMTLCQKSELEGAIVVSTPQDVALLDARKALDMFATLKTPVLGLIENMSVFACPHCGKESHIFGHGGVAAEAAKMGVPLLAALPIDLDTRLGGDAGTPIAAGNSPMAEAYATLAARLIAEGHA